MFNNKENYSKTFADLKMDSSLDYIYKDYSRSSIKIKYFLKLKYGIDSISNYSNKGLYYENPLIFGITRKNINLIKEILENGSSPRGYQKFPGYPLFKALELLNHDISINNNYESSEDTMIKIIELLFQYGARFDDFVTHVYWYKYYQTINSLSIKNKKIMKKLYNLAPFTLKKYRQYLDIFCEDSILNKEDMLKNFISNHPKKQKFIFFNQ